MKPNKVIRNVLLIATVLYVGIITGVLAMHLSDTSNEPYRYSEPIAENTLVVDTHENWPHPEPACPPIESVYIPPEPVPPPPVPEPKCPCEAGCPCSPYCNCLLTTRVNNPSMITRGDYFLRVHRGECDTDYELIMVLGEQHMCRNGDPSSLGVDVVYLGTDDNNWLVPQKYTFLPLEDAGIISYNYAHWRNPYNTTLYKIGNITEISAETLRNSDIVR